MTGEESLGKVQREKMVKQPTEKAKVRRVSKKGTLPIRRGQQR